MDFFKFGVDAEDLPSDPNLLKNGKTYKSNPTDQFVEYGFSNKSIVESSQFNGFIIYIISLIKLIVCGIRKMRSSWPVSPQKDDLRINNSSNLEIYDGTKWNAFKYEATETSVGYIYKNKLLTEDQVKLIPESTETQRGSILKTDKVSDLSKYKNTRASYHKVYHDVDDARASYPYGSFELINIEYNYKNFLKNISNDMLVCDIYTRYMYNESIFFVVDGFILAVA